MGTTIDTSPVTSTFLGMPASTRVGPGLDADVAILGLPHGDPYLGDEDPNDQSNAPCAIREASARLTMGADHHDFDLGGTLLDGRDVRVFDCGDVRRVDRDGSLEHYGRAEAAARAILADGALLVVLGGDHGVPIPVFRALDVVDGDPVTLVHVDAHLDWRDEVGGIRQGYSSPIRRASELGHIGRIVQIGLRAQGSARAQEVSDARAYGAELITAYEIHRHGVAPVLDRLPRGGPFYLTIDADGLDPSVMPAVAGPAPGGLGFAHVRELVHGLVQRGRLVGMDIVEITPARDVNGISSLTAGQLVLNAIGAATRAGYFEARRGGPR